MNERRAKCKRAAEELGESTVIGKGDELPIIPVTNRRQWVRKDPGTRKIYSIALERC